MIKSKLHNPIIAKNSYIENAVVEKVDNSTELTFSDLGNATPVVPEHGRIWYNTDSGTFRFANITTNGTNENYVDEFLSRTDLRSQSVVSTVDFKDSISVFDKDDNKILFVDSTNKNIILDNPSASTSIKSDNITATANTVELFDAANNSKILANNALDKLTINYNTIDFNTASINATVTSTFKLNDGSTDKLVIDNIADTIEITYDNFTANTTNTQFNTTNTFELTDGTNSKIKADNTNNELTINYASSMINGDVSVDGNMIVSGDLTVGGQTTKVDVQSENLSIADNIITLNSNLDNTVDPRLASALVDGEDVDHNAGIDVNRGSQGTFHLLQLVESTDTSTDETLKEAKAKISIWNYEAVTPAYELHQIIDAYTAGRQIKDKSGSIWIGYDGEIGTNYQNALDAGATDVEASKYAFKLDADKLDNTIDAIVQKIDHDNFNSYNNVRVGETPTEGTSFTITHNLGTVFVDVRVQRQENSKWYFDVLPIEVVDENTIKIETTESTKIRYMISSIQGFDVDQSTDLIVS